ncbi:cellulose binding domain-containing protein [Streptosporangium sp. 'caverna']|uniref:cellulose binding domain-containing protein n=1 Tax=Streptosporangium sp. 'caverna' TaxID=2202249 RepID=UPI000D7E20C1|nr:cellulose binding domain-containing protein [Streptosporangium sp. 'caverna']AWS45622.1 hypothetical protein DKM19_34270 [Streptosporangium sp. 'caverna']
MPLSRPRGAALRGLLLGCCAAAAAAALLGAGSPPASDAVSGTARIGVAVADTAPPSTPGGLTPRTIYLNGVAGLSWTPSADDVAVAGYEVYAWSYSNPTVDSFSRVPARITSSSATEVTAEVPDLTPDRDFLFYVRAVDAAGNKSVPSLLVRNTAMTEPPVPGPSPWPAAPARPYDLRVYAGPAPGYVGMQWAIAGGTGQALIDVFRRSSSEWSYAGYSRLPRTMARVGDEASYTFQVVGVGEAGDLSDPSNAATYLRSSPTPTATPTVTPAPVACAVTYTARNWRTGFTADVTIKNTGKTPIDGWRLEFGFPLTAQHLTSGWSATWVQSGMTVVATNLAWNKTVKPGQSMAIGFNGTHSGDNPSPLTFKLNGSRCIPE